MLNEFLYTGRRLDPLTGLYQYRYRYYHAQMGRFINRDPIGYIAEDMNLYAYVSGVAVSATDPFGLSPYCLITEIDYEIEGLEVAINLAGGGRAAAFGADSDNSTAERVASTLRKVLKFNGFGQLGNRLKFYARASLPTNGIAKMMVLEGVEISLIYDVEYKFYCCQDGRDDVNEVEIDDVVWRLGGAMVNQTSGQGWIDLTQGRNDIERLVKLALKAGKVANQTLVTTGLNGFEQKVVNAALADVVGKGSCLCKEAIQHPVPPLKPVQQPGNPPAAGR